MSLLLDVPTPLALPRVRLVPDAADSEGGWACDLAAGYGLRAFPWQRAALTDLMGVRPDGLWAASRAGLSVPRQNGKNGAAEIYELYVTSQLGMRVLHSAHEVKALDVSTPILAERGWTTMGQLVTGDRVYGPDGRLTNVIAHPIRHGRPCYRLRFDDGQEVVADEDHLWGVTHVVGTRQISRVISTREIVSEGVSVTSARTGRDRRTYTFRVRLTSPIQFPEARFDVAPWLLGAWLGDGTSAKGELTVGAEDLSWVLAQLTLLGETYRVRPDRRWPDRVFAVLIEGLKGRLASLGVLNNKHIPDSYLRCAPGQRQGLLAGLMDTDGSSSGGQAVIGMMKESLVVDILGLVRSLGYKASKHKVTARTNGVDKGVCHRVQFRVDTETSPFLLPRKTFRLPAPQRSATRANYNAIVAAEAVEPRDTRCITVDNNSSLYLVGAGFIPTHNTARKAFKRLLDFYDNSRQYPELRDLVKEVRRTNGQEAVELHNGGSVEFVARTKSSGRGYSVDVLLMDEAQELTEEALEAMQSTVSASANPQTFLMGTPPKDDKPATVWRRFRQTGVQGTDPELCWIEYGASPGDDLDDRAVQSGANPGAPESISWRTIDNERASLTSEGFACERLGVWRDGAGAQSVVDAARWAGLADPDAVRGPRPVFAVATAPDRSWSAIAVAWRRPDSLVQVMLSDYHADATWVPARLAELEARWGGTVVDRASRGLVDGADPASQEDVAVAEAVFADAVLAGTVRHGNEPALNIAAKAARWRPVGDTRVLDRKGSADISPVVAAALAVHGVVSRAEVDLTQSVW